MYTSYTAPACLGRHRITPRLRAPAYTPYRYTIDALCLTDKRVCARARETFSQNALVYKILYDSARRARCAVIHIYVQYALWKCDGRAVFDSVAVNPVVANAHEIESTIYNLFAGFWVMQF